jgi:hypothetical protein
MRVTRVPQSLPFTRSILPAFSGEAALKVKYSEKM